MGKEKRTNNSESIQRVENLSDLLPALQSGAQVAAIEGLPLSQDSAALSQDSAILAKNFGGPIVWDFLKIKGFRTNDSEALEARLLENRPKFSHGIVPVALWDALSKEILSVLKQFPNYVVESEYLEINAGADQSIRMWHRDGGGGPVNYSNCLRVVRTLHGPSTEYSESNRGPIVRFKDNSLCVHTCGSKGALHRTPRNGTGARISYAIMLRPVPQSSIF